MTSGIKISALTAQTGASVATGDEFVVNDVSDTTMAASGTTKSITANEAVSAITRLGALTQVRQLGSVRWDDFHRADARLVDSATLPSGHTWLTGFDSGPTDDDLVITNNELFLNASGASYLHTIGGKERTLASCSCTNGSRTVTTSVASTFSSADLGAPFVMNSIPNDARIVKVNSDTSVDLDKAATADDGPRLAWVFDYIADPSAAAVEFYFKSGSTNNAAVGLLIGRRVTHAAGTVTGGINLALSAVHLSIGAASWGLSFFDGTTYSPATFSGTYSLSENTLYRVSIERIAYDRVRINLPDGTSTDCRDSRIGRLWGSTVVLEHYQPSASYATDRLPVFTGVAVFPSPSRRNSISPVTGAYGVPGTMPLSTGALAFTVGVRYYYPFEVSEPIVVTAAIMEQVAAGAAGTKSHAAIYVAGTDWKPENPSVKSSTAVTLMSDLGEIAVDGANGVKTFPQSNGPVILWPGRYLLMYESTNAAAGNARYVAYTAPFGLVRSTLSTTPLANGMSVATAYASSAPEPGTAWTALAASTVPNLCPVQLAWTVL